MGNYFGLSKYLVISSSHTSNLVSVSLRDAVICTVRYLKFNINFSSINYSTKCQNRNACVSKIMEFSQIITSLLT